jgi:mRNA-degrading endonuclease toxin of MazEF toxin-antitoxin module
MKASNPCYSDNNYMKDTGSNTGARTRFALFNRNGLTPEEAKIEARVTMRSLLIAAIGGLPIAAIVLILKDIIGRLSLTLSGVSDASRGVYQVGLSVGFALLLLMGVLALTPLIWRKISKPKNLIILAYFSITSIAIIIGMLFSGSVSSTFWLSWWLGGVSTAAWWAWEQRWRGMGVAPSPLAGVLRPEMYPGQIWFASVHGKQSTKVRPVVILKPLPDGVHWQVAYFTTQKPKYEKFKKMYLNVPIGTIRGIAVENWVSLVDVQSLSRSKFRTYIGLAPTTLYEKVMEAYGFALETNARTIDEEIAGQQIAPSHKSILNILGIRRDAKPDPSDTISWGTALRLFNLPIESKKDRVSRAARQNSKKD